MINAMTAYKTAIEKNTRFNDDLNLIEKKIKEACEAGRFTVTISGLDTDNFDSYVLYMSKFGFRCSYIRGSSYLQVDWPTPKESA